MIKVIKLTQTFVLKGFLSRTILWSGETTFTIWCTWRWANSS